MIALNQVSGKVLRMDQTLDDAVCEAGVAQVGEPWHLQVFRIIVRRVRVEQGGYLF